MKNLYTCNFTVDNFGRNKEFTGFESDLTSGYFEAGWSPALLWHDIFEHWFESSSYFSTKELSQAGECVAMGIRQWFYDYTNLVQKYAAYNLFRGVEWNSAQTILSQIVEAHEEIEEYGHSEYGLDFDYVTLPEYEPQDQFKGFINPYMTDYIDYDLPSGIIDKIEGALDYGYWLAEFLYSDMIHIIDKFMSNLVQFLTFTGIYDEHRDYYESCPFPIDGRKLVVQVRKNEVIAKFGSLYITSNQQPETIDKVSRQFLNEFEYEYV